ncbi:MAG: hypothetical protein QME21_04860 [Anaerolineales bacterium]|nr:hypothetical protein [Anaerolineales bacterium]
MNQRVYLSKSVPRGAVSQSLTANDVLGLYEVTANTVGATAPVVFILSNIPPTYSIFLPLVSRQP